MTQSSIESFAGQGLKCGSGIAPQRERKAELSIWSQPRLSMPGSAQSLHLKPRNVTWHMANNCVCDVGAETTTAKEMITTKNRSKGMEGKHHSYVTNMVWTKQQSNPFHNAGGVSSSA